MYTYKQDGIVRVGSREFSYKEIELIQETVSLFPALSRKQIASAVCENLNWKNEANRLKTSSALSLLNKLEKLGKIILPPLRSSTPINKIAKRELYDVPDKKELFGSTENYTVSIEPVVSSKDIDDWNDLVERYHYLGYKKILDYI